MEVAKVPLTERLANECRHGTCPVGDITNCPFVDVHPYERIIDIYICCSEVTQFHWDNELSNPQHHNNQ